VSDRLCRYLPLVIRASILALGSHRKREARPPEAYSPTDGWCDEVGSRLDLAVRDEKCEFHAPQETVSL